MSRKLHMLLRALAVSAGAAVLGFVVLFFVEKIVVNEYIFSDFNYAVVSGQQKNHSSINVNIDTSGKKDSKAGNNSTIGKTDVDSVSDNSVINVEDWIEPVIGEQYGIISCEKIGLEVPLYCGDSDTILKKGAGSSVHASFPGQGKAILVGGHDTTFFAPLEKLEKNDEIIVNTSYGNYKYNVSEKSIIKGSDYNIDTDKEKLILYTCYPFGEVSADRTQKVIFECVLIEGPSIGGADR